MAGKRRVSIRIDMTPMVDIAFLLLIFYMATTQFKPPEARAVDLPESHSMIELPDKDIINITITKYDSIYVDYIMLAEVEIEGKLITMSVRRVRRCDKYTVTGEVNRARASGGHKALIVVKGDHQASFGAMQDVMKKMQEDGLERFLIITDLESSVGETE